MRDEERADLLQNTLICTQRGQERMTELVTQRLQLQSSMRTFIYLQNPDPIPINTFQNGENSIAQSQLLVSHTGSIQKPVKPMLIQRNERSNFETITLDELDKFFMEYQRKSKEFKTIVTFANFLGDTRK